MRGLWLWSHLRSFGCRVGRAAGSCLSKLSVAQIKKAATARAASARTVGSQPALKAVWEIAITLKRDALRCLAAVVICAAAALYFSTQVMAQDGIPAKTMKDLEQDSAIYELQVQQATMQKEIQALIRLVNHQAVEQSHDEGIAIGAFLFLGILQSEGIFRLLDRVGGKRREAQKETAEQ